METPLQLLIACMILAPVPPNMEPDRGSTDDILLTTHSISLSGVNVVLSFKQIPSGPRSN